MKRNSILRAARKLFFEKGFRDVSVENIARKADLAKGSIYLHFKSKEEIYTQILLNDNETFHRKVEGLPESDAPPIAMLEEFCRIYVDFFLSDRELFRILMNFMLHTENMNLAEETHQHIVRITNRNMEILEAILRRGVEQGVFFPSLDVHRIRNAIWGLMNGIISLHLFTGSPARREERITATLRECLGALIAGITQRRSPAIDDDRHSAQAVTAQKNR